MASRLSLVGNSQLGIQVALDTREVRQPAGGTRLTKTCLRAWCLKFQRSCAVQCHAEQWRRLAQGLGKKFASADLADVSLTRPIRHYLTRVIRHGGQARPGAWPRERLIGRPNLLTATSDPIM